MTEALASRGRVPALPEGLSQEDIQDADTIFGALAPGTRAVYSGHVRRYRRAGYKLEGRDLARWIADQIEAGTPPATIKIRTAAVRKFCACLDKPIIGRANELVKAALIRASRENRGRGSGQVAGAGWPLADAAARLAARTGDWLGIRDACMVLLASDGMLRISEVAALNFDDIAKAPDGSGRLTIRASKTDQAGRGETLFLGDSTLAGVRKWLAVSEITTGPLFTSTRGRRIGRRIGPAAVRSVLVKRLKAAGATGRISGHSLRRGSAASLVEAGASLPEVMESGRWIGPEQVKIYLSGQLIETGGVAKYRYPANL